MQRIARGEVMHAGTFNTYNAGVAAAVASIELLTRDNARAFDDLTRLGKSLMSGIRRIGRDQKENLIVQGLGPMFHVGFTKLRAVHDYRECEMYDRGRYGRLVLAMLKRGIRLIGRGIWYVSTAHTRQDVDRTLDAFSDSLKETRSG
jgi:glutamate-1-semialdehyde 2,1-aminomutase